MNSRNFVDCCGTEAVTIVDDIVYIFGRDAEHGWYVMAGGDIEPFYSGRVAAGTFRLYVETAMLAQEARRREQPEPPFVLGRVKLEAADLLPV